MNPLFKVEEYQAYMQPYGFGNVARQILYGRPFGSGVRTGGFMKMVNKMVGDCLGYSNTKPELTRFLNEG